MNTTRRSVIAFSIALLPFLIGCGGGGSSSNSIVEPVATPTPTPSISSSPGASPSPTPSPTPTPGNVIPLVSKAIFQQGQYYHRWRGTGTYEESGTGVQVPVVVVHTDATNQQLYDGEQTILLKKSWRFDIENTPQYVTYDDVVDVDSRSNDMYQLAWITPRNNVYRAIEKKIVIPGTFFVGYSHDRNFEYTSYLGTVYSRDIFQITGTEVATAYFGAMDCWKVNRTITNSVFTQQSTLWYAPQTGSFIKEETVLTFDEGRKTLRYSATLDQTDVVLP
jgi:hypothetical protein